MLGKLRQAYDTFQQTLTEANYHPEPQSPLRSLFALNATKLPETSNAAKFGKQMLTKSTKIGRGYLWAPLMGLASLKLQMASGVLTAIGGLAFGVAGAGLFILEYNRSKRIRMEVIKEVNFAGQTVEGSRADLCRLYQAQMKIMNIHDSFKKASLENTGDTIQSIIDRVRD